jgi:hypothetical protein
MIKTHIRKSPQEIRDAADKLIERHDANFNKWLEEFQKTIYTRSANPSKLMGSTVAKRPKK